MTPKAPNASPDINDPDRQNAEQDETGTQAQDVAQDALEQPRRARSGEGSEHGGRSDPGAIIPDDAQDLVDHMTDMDHSGRIDMDAYDGEPYMDDEDEGEEDESKDEGAEALGMHVDKRSG